MLVLQACSSKIEKDGSVQIKIDPDPVKVGEVAYVKLHLDHYKEIIPEFYIIYKGDTGQLRFYPEEGFAMLEMVNSNPGHYSYNGFVKYYKNQSTECVDQYTVNLEVVE